MPHDYQTRFFNLTNPGSPSSMDKDLTKLSVAGWEVVQVVPWVSWGIENVHLSDIVEERRPNGLLVMLRRDSVADAGLLQGPTAKIKNLKTARKLP